MGADSATIQQPRAAIRWLPFATEGLAARRPGLPLLAGTVLVLIFAGAVAALLAQTIRAGQLERELSVERVRLNVVQDTLLGEMRAASERTAALEEDLRAIEGEAERLYEAVRAMHSLGEQLSERVGLVEVALEPPPELPPRAAVHAARSHGEEITDGSTLAGLPADTGPWPRGSGVADSSADAAARVAIAGQVALRQWDAWQALGQAVEEALGRRSRAARPVIRPAYGRITSGFGHRAGFYGVLAFHTGIDISLPVGTPIVATADGIVSFVGALSSFGNTVEIQHAGGVKTVYAHLSRPLVWSGQHVAQGQVIALSGNTGMSTGPHLHYEIRIHNTPVDPTAYW